MFVRFWDVIAFRHRVYVILRVCASVLNNLHKSSTPPYIHRREEVGVYPLGYFFSSAPLTDYIISLYLVILARFSCSFRTSRNIVSSFPFKREYLAFVLSVVLEAPMYFQWMIKFRYHMHSAVIIYSLFSFSRVAHLSFPHEKSLNKLVEEETSFLLQYSNMPT